MEVTGIRDTNVWFRVPGVSPLVCVTNAFLFSVPSIGSDSITIHGDNGPLCLLAFYITNRPAVAPQASVLPLCLKNPSKQGRRELWCPPQSNRNCPWHSALLLLWPG